jgi:hypothetical protein
MWCRIGKVEYWSDGFRSQYSDISILHFSWAAHLSLFEQPGTEFFERQ